MVCSHIKRADFTKTTKVRKWVGSYTLGLKDFVGFDLNPLAVLISEVRFTKINPTRLESAINTFKKEAYGYAGSQPENNVVVEKFTNFDYWFRPQTAARLQILKNLIMDIKQNKVRNFLLLILSSAVRDCSYVRNNEFKLYKMKEEAALAFNPDVLGIFFSYCEKVFSVYTRYYFDTLEHAKLKIHNREFTYDGSQYDIVLTSPPYGDSGTTVAYGQFSLFTNHWLLGLKHARNMDKQLMGGSLRTGDATAGNIAHSETILNPFIEKIKRADARRGREVICFYQDLAQSICRVAQAIKRGGFVIYVVGNRTVKGITLPTDQFIAEQFERQGLEHRVTYRRKISNKRMPKLNSPSNQAGKKMTTMNDEFIVVCRQVH